jgi:hypothetical protein
MADFEMTPEMVKEETTSLTEEVADQITDVQEAAAAIAEMPIIDLEAEASLLQRRTLLQSSHLMSRDRSNLLQRRSISQTATQFSATEQAHSARYRILLTELSQA